MVKPNPKKAHVPSILAFYDIANNYKKGQASPDI